MDFVAMAVSLKNRESRVHVTPADGDFAHAAVMYAITEKWPEIGQYLHEEKRNKHISLSFFLDPRNSQRAILRICLFRLPRVDWIQKVIQLFCAKKYLRIHGVAYEVEAVDVESDNYGNVKNWEEMLYPDSAQKFRFDFNTPTAFAKRYNETSRRYFALFPTPFDLFSTLATRWNSLSKTILSQHFIQYIETGGCVVSRVENYKTVEYFTKDRTQIGFTGTVVYQTIDAPADILMNLIYLTRLSSFTGVGYQTGRGMGYVQTTLLKNRDAHD